MPKPSKKSPEQPAEKIPKRLLRRLAALENEMRKHLRNFRRVPAIESEKQVTYFIKLMEAFLAANGGTIREEAMRQLVMGKLWQEYYIWD